MSFAYVWLRNLSTVTLALCLFSCAHAPDPHVHLKVPAPVPGTPIVVQGQITNAETGDPVPHKVLYLLDIRPENWDSLDRHTVRLGTANREGRVDVALHWPARRKHRLAPKGDMGRDRISDYRSIALAAEARCHAGNPAAIAVVIDPDNDEPTILFFNTSDFLTSASGVPILDIGDVELKLAFLNGDYTDEESRILDESEVPEEVPR